jgi:putative ABC transport system substrate-binding protein
MRRRDFITLLGGAATAWPLAARAQQALPVIGFLHPSSPDAYAARLSGFRQGLKESGYAEGETVAIVYRWAENRLDKLPELAADLVRRRVAVIVAPQGVQSVLAAKAATMSIPIVFSVPEDPVRVGLVASLARPGGNLTGINFFNSELTAKRLQLLRELVPGAVRVALLVNPTNVTNAEVAARDADAAARSMGLQIRVLNASTGGEIDSAFTLLARERPDALFVIGDALFNTRRLQMALLAARYAIPASYASRDYAEAGGLMSYGTDVTDAYRKVGVYAGRILKGAKPAELPVEQSSKFELVINALTAKLLGLTVPPTLVAVADEVIE